MNKRYKKNNIYSLPVSERRNKFLKLLSKTDGDTDGALRGEKDIGRDKVLKILRLLMLI